MGKTDNAASTQTRPDRRTRGGVPQDRGPFRAAAAAGVCVQLSRPHLHRLRRADHEPRPRAEREPVRLGAGIFFPGYCVFEIPSNMALYRFGARRWIARIMITWGLASAGDGLVVGPNSFYLVRFLLGVAEAGFFPGVTYFLAAWFPAQYRTRMLAWFVLGIPLSSVIGGPICGALLQLNGVLGLAGWKWLFLVGQPAVRGDRHRRSAAAGRLAARGYLADARGAGRGRSGAGGRDAGAAEGAPAGRVARRAGVDPGAECSSASRWVRMGSASGCR